MIVSKQDQRSDWKDLRKFKRFMRPANKSDRQVLYHKQKLRAS